MCRNLKHIPLLICKMHTCMGILKRWISMHVPRDGPRETVVPRRGLHADSLHGPESPAEECSIQLPAISSNKAVLITHFSPFLFSDSSRPLDFPSSLLHSSHMPGGQASNLLEKDFSSESSFHQIAAVWWKVTCSLMENLCLLPACIG